MIREIMSVDSVPWAEASKTFTLVNINIITYQLMIMYKYIYTMVCSYVRKYSY
jgi:hypothetical protein